MSWLSRDDTEQEKDTKTFHKMFVGMFAILALEIGCGLYRERAIEQQNPLKDLKKNCVPVTRKINEIIDKVSKYKIK